VIDCEATPNAGAQGSEIEFLSAEVVLARSIEPSVLKASVPEATMPLVRPVVSDDGSM
jgi:hypothetical protein